MARKASLPVTVEHFGTQPAYDDGDQSGGRWFAAEEADVHRHVFSVVRAIEGSQSGLYASRLKFERLYGNREISGLSASKYAHTTVRRREDRLTLNVCKSCVDTASAKISKNKPRPLFLTSGGDASMQDKAKALTKFCEGMFAAAHVYETGQKAFVDACIVDTGVAKVVDEDGEIRVERVFVDELRIDQVEAAHGDPRQLHQVRPVHYERLLALFPNDAEKRHAIRAARKRDGSTVDCVDVVESWHLRSSKDAKDGKRAFCIDGCTLAFEDYDADYFPFAMLYWTQPRRGVYGQGLVEELVGIQVEINRLLRTIQEAMHLACVPRVYFDSATAATLKPLDNEMGGHYSFVGRPPIISTANAMPSEVYSHLENLFRKAFEITGISQLAASSRKPAGLDSGVALREFQDIETERFVLVGQRYEEFYMQIARIMLDLMRARAKRGGVSTTVKTRDGKHVESVDWKDVDLDEDKYEMRVFPVSFLPTSPAGRLQTVKELVKDGFISDRAQALSLLDFPDLEAFQSLQTASYDNIRHIVDGILERGEFRAPDKYINIPLARQTAQNAYERGEANGRPRERLDDLATWMTMLDDLEDAMKAPPPPPAGATVPMGEGPAPPQMPQAAPPILT